TLMMCALPGPLFWGRPTPAPTAGMRATGRIGTERFSRGNQLQSCNDISGSAALVGASRDREILALCPE
ncbi:hypothetical protein FCZ12_25260, partial [Escherichia coli]|nr:hypothetical protein [Escherichia coli]